MYKPTDVQTVTLSCPLTIAVMLTSCRCLLKDLPSDFRIATLRKSSKEEKKFLTTAKKVLSAGFAQRSSEGESRVANTSMFISASKAQIMSEQAFEDENFRI